MEGIIWAMSCLRKFHCTAIHIETDCSDLVDMLDSPADWPAFAFELVSFRLLKDGFSDFSISAYPGLGICERILSLKKQEIAVLFFPM